MICRNFRHGVCPLVIYFIVLVLLLVSCSVGSSAGGEAGDGVPADGGDDSSGWLNEDSLDTSDPATRGVSDSGGSDETAGGEGVDDDLPLATGFVSVSAGWDYSCGLYGSGEVECWVFGDFGRLTEDRLFRGRKLFPWDVEVDVSAYEPPSGVFTEVSSGWGFACGVRPDGGVECWGPNRSAYEDPPEGSFMSLSAGVEHICGVRPGNVAECWGSSTPRREAGVPLSGVFTSVAVGSSFSCGLRSGGELECWGGAYSPRRRGQETAELPPSRFKSIDASGGGLMCGVRIDEGGECWPSLDERHFEEGLRLLDVGGGSRGDQVCGLRSDGGVECLEDGDETPLSAVETLQGGPFMDVAVSKTYGVCGLLAAGEVRCWAGAGGVELIAPEGEFAELDGGYSHKCGIRPDASVACWPLIRMPEGDEIQEGAPCGLRSDGLVECIVNRSIVKYWDASAPPGRFRMVSAGWNHSCGVRVGGSVECWGSDDFGESSPPEGEFVEVSAGNALSCGVRVGGEVECWGSGKGHAKIVLPEGELVSVSAGWGGHRIFLDYDGYYDSETDWGYSCGLRPGGEAVCWGDNPDRSGDGGELLVPPVGAFLDVEMGERHACGLRPEGSLECWGEGVLSSVEGEGFSSIDVGGDIVCGLRSRGEAACWEIGRREYVCRVGEDGSEKCEEEPTVFSYVESGPFIQVSVGRTHACGLLVRGDAECWSSYNGERISVVSRKS